jgi:hypothetical protein
MSYSRLQLAEPDAPVSSLWRVWVQLLLRALRERTLWLALVAGLAAVTFAYQSPRSLYADMGGRVEAAQHTGFYQPEGGGDAGANFRWSSANSSLIFYGTGKPLAPASVSLQLSSGRDVGAEPIEVGVLVNGHPAPALKLIRESASYKIDIPPEWVDLAGDIQLDFTSATFNAPKDRRDLGFRIDFARVEMLVGVTLPSLTQVLWLALSALFLYWLLRSIWLTPKAAGLLTFLFLITCAAILAAQRLFLTIYTSRLAFTLLLALLIAFVVEMLVRRLVRAAGWRGERALPEWAWLGLRGLVMASVTLKVGGLLHPFSFIIDAEFHLRYIGYMAEGQMQYFGDSLAFAVMPKEEWGSARTFIPYSPFFFVVAAPLAWLPIPTNISVPVVLATLESVKVGLVYMVGIGLASIFGNHIRRERVGRIALATAAFYSFIPATFLLQQWGNWPTQLSLWLATLWTALVTLYWHQLTTPLVWAASTALLALTMLSYTVTAVYIGLFVGVIVAVGWLFVMEERRRWLALFLSLVAATGVAMLVYYGQYVARILGDTLPTLGGAITTEGKATDKWSTPWDFLADRLAAMHSYHLVIISALALAGVLWLFFSGANRSNNGGGQWQKVWLGGWLVVFALISVADYWVDQVLKQFWFSFPLIALLGGTWLLAIKGRGSRIYNMLTSLVMVTLVWQSLSLWVFRLFFH